MRPGNKDFSGLDLQGADFSDLDLSGAVFTNSNLESANFEGTILKNANFSRANLGGVNFSNSNLTDADLQHAKLRGNDLTSATIENADFRNVEALGVNLSGKDLTATNLSYGDFRLANFEDSNFNGSEISGINLYSASLVGARISDCVIKNASLVDCDLSNTDLRQTTFHKGDVRGMNIENAQLSGSTEFRGFCWEPDDSRSWDTLAKSYDEIREEFKRNALNTSQKSLYFLQQRARTVEALSERSYLSFLLGMISELLTGYGVRVRYTLVWTVLLIAVSTIWYSSIPESTWEGGPLHYSVTTFVTSAPHPPDSSQSELMNDLTRAVVLFETYFGTVLIILLGYVLGNRDSF